MNTPSLSPKAIFSSGVAPASLKRQVHIAAGVMVLLAVVLGVFSHSAFYGLAAAVGAGLIWAGLANPYLMGRLLMACPWNK